MISHGNLPILHGSKPLPRLVSLLISDSVRLSAGRTAHQEGGPASRAARAAAGA